MRTASARVTLGPRPSANASAPACQRSDRGHTIPLNPEQLCKTMFLHLERTSCLWSGPPGYTSGSLPLQMLCCTAFLLPILSCHEPNLSRWLVGKVVV